MPKAVAAIAVALARVLAVGTPAEAAEVELLVPEAVVRTAPFDVAPELAQVKAGDRLTADDQANGPWRRVRLPDGRFGFVRDADVKVASPAPSPQPATPAAALAVAAQRAPEPDPSTSKPTRLGVVFSILPVGTLAVRENIQGSGSTNASVDSAFAVAVAPTLDILASPYFSFGLSPQVIFRVGGAGSSAQSAKEVDIRARLTGRLPVSSAGTAVYARLSPGFSMVVFPTPRSDEASVPDPKGFVVDLSVGTEIAVLPRLLAVIDLGYQLGLQSADIGDTTFEGTRYLHLGAGLAVGF